METLTLLPPHFRKFNSPFPLLSLIRRSMSIKSHLTMASYKKTDADEIPIAGTDSAFMGFITGKKKATEVAHSVWKSIIQKGDTVIDATCGNGYDTLALLMMVSDESYNGCVFGMDIQQEALDNTSSLLEISVEENKRKLVKLFKLCHSKLEDIVQETPACSIQFGVFAWRRQNNSYIAKNNTSRFACCLQSSAIWRNYKRHGLHWASWRKG
ncbi:uncharacterized protein LOC122030148 isoform X2 [Zingiber officinale]|uniref:uncharacterized protein LOC122030148 isoform X2 n=1 Tax=Zingiber officinale TaxID=94328 RepID=UPI001C4B8B0E|nr:uncharacterized protein LOC122030148 isoform X2 [Zingiber officinale]